MAAKNPQKQAGQNIYPWNKSSAVGFRYYGQEYKDLFYAGQPNDENGLYVFSNCYGSHGKWCDKEGEDQLTFICEYEL